MKATNIYQSANYVSNPKGKSSLPIEHFDQSKAEKAVLEKAREAKENGRPLKLGKPKRQSIPKNLERQYLRKINKILTAIMEDISKKVVEELPKLVEQNEKKKPKADSVEIRMDINVAKRLGKLFASVRGEMARKFPKKELEKLATKTGRDVNRFNKQQVGKVFESVLGVSLFSREPFLKEELQEFAISNANLIKNVTSDFVDKTQQIVFTGLRKGLRHEEIAKQILGRTKDKQGFVSKFKKSKTRAALIARDQVNKLNGQLTEIRQTSAGVKKYIWRTVRDTRVRGTPGTPSAGLPLDFNHFKREGEEFSWNDPPADGHPGEPINCRCFAEPVLEDLI